MPTSKSIHDSVKTAVGIINDQRLHPLGISYSNLTTELRNMYKLSLSEVRELILDAHKDISVGSYSYSDGRQPLFAPVSYIESLRVDHGEGLSFTIGDTPVQMWSDLNEAETLRHIEEAIQNAETGIGFRDLKQYLVHIGWMGTDQEAHSAAMRALKKLDKADYYVQETKEGKMYHYTAKPGAPNPEPPLPDPKPHRRSKPVPVHKETPIPPLGYQVSIVKSLGLISSITVHFSDGEEIIYNLSGERILSTEPLETTMTLKSEHHGVTNVTFLRTDGQYENVSMTDVYIYVDV